MILVTGATGALGSAVVRRLLARTDAADIAVPVRAERKAADLAGRGVAVRVGDYDDTAALDRALVGVDRVLLVAGNDPQPRVQQHQNMIDACVPAGVGLMGFASRSLRDVQASANTLMGDYFQTEDHIRRSGLRHVLFRNALYLDTVPVYVGGARVFQTVIRLPAGNGKVPTHSAERWVKPWRMPYSTPPARTGPTSSPLRGPTPSTTWRPPSPTSPAEL